MLYYKQMTVHKEARKTAFKCNHCLIKPIFSEFPARAVRSWMQVKTGMPEAVETMHCTSFRFVALIRHVTTTDFQLLADVQAISSLIISSESNIFYARAKTSKPMEELAENVDTIPKHRAPIWKLAKSQSLHLSYMYNLRTYKRPHGMPRNSARH